MRAPDAPRTMTVVAVVCLLHSWSGAARAEAPVVAKELLGKWACSFSRGDVSYPPFRCAISLRQGKLWLEKLNGSQRIKGELTIFEAGLRLRGTFFCPYGDCTQGVTGVFTRTAPDRYEGPLDDGPEPTVVKLERAATRR